MINVTDSIKKAYEESTTQYDKIVLDGQEYDINNVQYEDDCYLDGNIFGTAIARTLDFEIENIVDLENKEFKYLTGIKTENGIKWIELGTFITQEVEPNDTTNINKVTAMDYMLKSNIEYVSSLNYGSGKVTILQVLQEACQEAGMILATTDFANAGFIVDSNQFTEGSLIRQVFQAVAQISGTFAKIRYDDKLYFITPKRTGLEVKDVHKMLVKDLDKLLVLKLAGCEFKMKMNDYSELILKRNTHPINLVSLGISDIEGENVVMRDEESIAEDGENSLVINDNPFAYTEDKRKQLITALFNTVKGFEYTSFEITGQAKPYQETGDEVVVVDKDGTFSYSFLFRFNYKSPNGLESEMSAPSLTKATVNYQNVASSEEQAIKRTELIVDKQNQTITGLITKTDNNTKKISEHTQTIDEIKDTLQSVTTTVSNTVKEVQVMYALSDSATQAPTSGWSVEAPEWQEGKYMWQKTVTTFSDDTQEESQATCIQGAAGKNGIDGKDGQDGINGTNGKDGKDGTDGLGIKSIETQYYLSTSETETTGGTWKSTQDKWSKGKYIWTRSKITWSDESVTYSSPVVAEGLNSANENADSANEGTKEVTTKMSEVEKTVEGITQTVNQTTERLNNDYSTTEQMNSAIEQKAGSITSSVTESIENIQVGGTNLIENSAPYNLDKWGISNSNSIELTLQDEETAVYGKCLRIRTLNQPTTACGIYIIPTTKVLETGKEYCFSIWLKATAATNVIVGYARGGQTTFNVTTEWKKFEYKFTALAPTGASHGFAINIPAGTTAGRSVYVHSIKLEEGNKITAWSPAPEDDVKGSEIGTKIEQNAKSVQVAWNQLSQSIKFEGDNNDATIAFYDGDKKFGEMGANTVDDNRYISFATLLDYGQSISDGMAWGIQTTSDNKFYPILFIKDFFMANKNAGNFSGQLVLNFCDLVLGTGAIKAANVRIGVDDTANGIYFEDTETGDILMRVYPDSNIGLARIDILNAISFYKNQGGSNSFKIGTSDKYVLITDEGDFHVMNGDLLLGTSDYPVSFSLYLRSLANIWGNVSIDGNIYADNISSDRRIKKNIEDSDTNALNIINKIKHRQFEMKKNGKHYSIGYIAQELEDVDKNFVLIREKDEKTEEQYYVNELPILATATKAIQELSEKVEQLQSKIDELEQKINEKEK